MSFVFFFPSFREPASVEAESFTHKPLIMSRDRESSILYAGLVNSSTLAREKKHSLLAVCLLSLDVDSYN